ncbi:ATP-binding cassette domain-containing protein [Devriesea agamarum]|uniref:ATP-binding cassette domain-containing protein n=1 Tax=Devriesea agamarum TaxID=472569 RepID=UPI00155EE136|nr:ABC transporter ATP-binding protein [Devriesea agamarum]
MSVSKSVSSTASSVDATGRDTQVAAAQIDIDKLFRPIPFAMTRCLLKLIRFAGWQFWVNIGLMFVKGILPAGFVYLLSQGANIADHYGLMVLLVILGSMFVADGILNSFSQPMQTNASDLMRARMHEMYQTVVSTWPDISVHEHPEIVGKKTQAKQALDRSGQLVWSFTFMLESLVALVPMLGLAFSVGVWFPVLLLIGMVPTAFIHVKFDRLIWRLDETFAGVHQRIGSVSDVAMEPMYAKDLRTFGMQKWAPRQWYRDQFRVLAAVFRLRNRAALYLAASSLFSSAGSIAACVLYIDPAHPSTIVLVLGVLVNIFHLIYGLVNGLNQLVAFQAPCASLMSFSKAQLSAPPLRQVTLHEGNALELEAVRYAYPSTSQEVLRGVTGIVPRGRMTCIVGPNGAGKSTLIKLLIGLYQPTHGLIRQSEDIQRIAVMNQDFARFPLSLRENLTCGHEFGIDDEELYELLDRVGLGELREARSTNVFKSKKQKVTLASVIRKDAEQAKTARGTLNGLDSYMYIDADGNGTNLSGGQWQRLAIARTVLHARHTGLALFDEPTSALDPYAESDLLDFIESEICGERMAVSGDRRNDSDGTLVLVTHRLSHAARADQVLVVEEGRITASGTPREVYQNSAWYREAFDLQAAGYLSSGT